MTREFGPRGDIRRTVRAPRNKRGIAMSPWEILGIPPPSQPLIPPQPVVVDSAPDIRHAVSQITKGTIEDWHRERAAKGVVFIADPPWRHETFSDKGQKKAPQYLTMTLSEMVALAHTVSQLRAKRPALMLMWCTPPQLVNGLSLLAAWGFEYKSYRIWLKARMGTGYWSRANSEIVLVGTAKGRSMTFPAPLPGTQGMQVFEGFGAGEHSSKPPYLHDEVDRLWPTAERIELFARHQRPNWKCVGADLGTLITANGIIPYAAEPERDTKTLSHSGDGTADARS